MKFSKAQNKSSWAGAQKLGKHDSMKTLQIENVPLYFLSWIEYEEKGSNVSSLCCPYSNQKIDGSVYLVPLETLTKMLRILCLRKTKMCYLKIL